CHGCLCRSPPFCLSFRSARRNLLLHFVLSITNTKLSAEESASALCSLHNRHKTVILSEVVRARCEPRSRKTCSCRCCCLCRCGFCRCCCFYNCHPSPKGGEPAVTVVLPLPALLLVIPQ